MPKIQEMKTRSYWKGKPKGKVNTKHFVIIPVEVIRKLGWKKSNEIQFDIKRKTAVLRKLKEK